MLLISLIIILMWASLTPGKEPSFKELLNNLIRSINTCRGNTSYTNDQIDNMVHSGVLIFSKIHSFVGKNYYLGVEKEGSTKFIPVKIKIDYYVFGHNSLGIYTYDRQILKCLKEILVDMKVRGEIERFTGDGWGRGLIIPYEIMRTLQSNYFAEVSGNIIKL